MPEKSRAPAVSMTPSVDSDAVAESSPETDLQSTVGNAAVASMLPPPVDSDGSSALCDPYVDFQDAVGCASAPDALTAIGGFQPAHLAQATADGPLLADVVTVFSLDDATQILDALGGLAPQVIFEFGAGKLVAGAETMDPAVVALALRRPTAWLDIGGFFAAAAEDVAPYLTLWGPDIAFQILRAQPVDGRRDALLALQASGDLADFMTGLSPEATATLQALIPEEEDSAKDVADTAKTSANPERAAVALAELTQKQSTDTNTPKRLTAGIVSLLTWGVGAAMNATDLGQEGIIGIDAAGNAADALIAMPLDLYAPILAGLVMTGGGDPASDRRVESILVLKAIGARKKEFTAGDSSAADDVSGFGDAIRGQDAEATKKATSTRDHGDGDGLIQKFTMSCGPTSIQTVHGEADPLFAAAVSATAKHDKAYDNDVADQQHDYLGKDVVPREVEEDWDAFGKAVVAHTTADPSADDALAALTDWISGIAGVDAGDLADGEKWAVSAGYSTTRLAEFQKYFALFNNAPGWANSDFEAKANAEIGSPTGGKFDERPIPPGYPDPATMTPVSTMTTADCDALYDALFRGKDVPMGIMWTNGGGHFMVFTDTRKKGAVGSETREFMISNPWDGKSAWITEANVIAGNVSPFGTGAIDSLYL